MTEEKKNRGFIDIIKDGLDNITRIVLASVAPPITESVEKVMQNFEDRVVRIQERMIKKLFSFAAIGLGALFMVCAFFFFLKEFLGWTNSAAFFSIGIIMFFIGLLLKLREK